MDRVRTRGAAEFGGRETVSGSPEQAAELLRALQAMRDGNFSVRLPGDWTGMSGKIADTFNDIAAANERIAGELARVARETGTDGMVGGQAIVPGVAGTWKDLIDSVNAMYGNLTGQVRNIAQVTTANRNLELRVAETAELVDAGRRKDEFLAMLAHELRSPLAAVRLAAQLVVLPNLPQAQLAKSAAIIHRQVEHLVRLIDDLVDVSRITRGLISLRRESTDISAVVAQAIEASRPVIDAKHHVLTVSVPDQSLRVSGDPARLSQVLGNILDNAAKFTDPGGRIALTVTHKGDDVVIHVADNGAGITDEMLPRIFDLFTQVDRPLDRASTGLGIGLALVHRLVEMHGGHVTARSEGPGKGAELIVQLPLVETGPAAAVLPEPVEQPAPPLLTSRRVLVVDDNVDAAEMLALMLKLHGHHVRTAHDGMDALRVAPAFVPHVIFLDLGMPNLNGYETANRIRSQPWGRDMALVALTGWGQPQDRKRTVEAGFDAHLVKPVDQNTLLKTLHEVVASRGQAQADRGAGQAQREA
jgi:signal transduction histidine kinase/CheY-like chemotaxis protein